MSSMSGAAAGTSPRRSTGHICRRGRAGRSHGRGFTLVEVLVAMTVLGLGLVLSAPLIAYAINRGTLARDLTAAQQLGTELLETLRSEIRFDAAAETASTATASTAWEANVLPHAVQPAGGAAAACVDGVCCQPADQDDGITYHYGPFAFAREGKRYWACYSLEQAAANDAGGKPRIGVPAGSADAAVRVLWRDGLGGWRSWSVGALLLDGRS